VSRIAGHCDAVSDRRTGLLFDDQRGLVEQLGRVLGDGGLRARLGRGALALAARRSWDGAARSSLLVLAEEKTRRAGR